MMDPVTSDVAAAMAADPLGLFLSELLPSGFFSPLNVGAVALSNGRAWDSTEQLVLTSHEPLFDQQADSYGKPVAWLRDSSGGGSIVLREEEYLNPRQALVRSSGIVPVAYRGMTSAADWSPSEDGLLRATSVDRSSVQPFALTVPGRNDDAIDYAPGSMPVTAPSTLATSSPPLLVIVGAIAALLFFL